MMVAKDAVGGVREASCSGRAGTSPNPRRWSSARAGRRSRLRSVCSPRRSTTVATRLPPLPRWKACSCGRAADLEPVPTGCSTMCTRALRNTGPGHHEVLDDPLSERLDVVDRMFARERVDRCCASCLGLRAGRCCRPRCRRRRSRLRARRSTVRSHRSVAVAPPRDLDQSDLRTFRSRASRRTIDIGQLPRYVLYPNGLSNSGT